MASKQIFEEVYTQTNIILCIKPQHGGNNILYEYMINT